MKKWLLENKTYLFVFLIIGLGFLSYSNVYKNEFVWDDEFYIQKNIYIRDFGNFKEIFTTQEGAGVGRLDNFYRPVKMVVYTFMYVTFGPEPWAFHALNVLIHVSSAILLFVLIKKIFGNEIIAFLTSLFWVVHPIHTEAVTYTSATQDPLALLFALTSFIMYIQFKEKKVFFSLFGSLIFFILALLSKESMIIFPGLIFAYELIFNCSKRNLKSLKNTISFFSISGIYFLLRLTVLNFTDTLNMYEQSNVYTQNIFYRIYTFMAALLSYYSLLLFPRGLHLERQFPIFISFLSPQVFISAIVLFLIYFILHSSFSNKNYYLSFGIFWFFVSFIPMSGILPVNSFLLEHWLYLPSIGFFLIISFLAYNLFQGNKYYKNFVILCIAAVICTLSFLTFQRNKDWKDPITFYNNILQYNEGSARLHNNLGMAYVDKEEYGLAEQQYFKAIELGDSYAETHYNLARLYIFQENIEKAIQHLEKSLEINSNFFYSHQLLYEIYTAQKNTQKAQYHYEQIQKMQYY